MTTGKTIALTRQTFVGKVTSLLFNMLSKGHSFSSKEQVSLNFMVAVSICSYFGAQKNKVCHCFHCFPINNLRYADDTTLMAESEEELMSLLKKVKEESEKVGLKLNIQKTKIMTSGPITSWQIYG